MQWRGEASFQKLNWNSHVGFGPPTSRSVNRLQPRNDAPKRECLTAKGQRLSTTVLIRLPGYHSGGVETEPLSRGCCFSWSFSSVLFSMGDYKMLVVDRDNSDVARSRKGISDTSPRGALSADPSLLLYKPGRDCLGLSNNNPGKII